MSQTDGGLRAVLAQPAVFRLFNRLMITRAGYGAWVSQYVHAKAGDRILDIGCGVGDIVASLPEVDYTGYDMSPRYIESARLAYGDRAKFVCRRVDEMTCEADAYDLVMAIGVLHHLEDREVLALCSVAKHALRPGGRLFMLDPGYTPDQSKLARFIISLDRGRHVRTERGYRELIAQVFDDISCQIRHDLLRFPYTHIMFDCLKD